MKQTHIAYGLVTAIIMVVFSTLLYVTGMSFKPGMQYLTEIPFLAGILLNAVAFSKANNGFVTFGNIFGSCFKASCIVTLVMLLWSFISLSIFPEMQTKALEMARQSMEQKNLADAQIDQALEMTQKHFKVFMIAGVIFGTMFWGAIFSLIGGGIAKKKGPSPEHSF